MSKTQGWHAPTVRGLRSWGAEIASPWARTLPRMSFAPLEVGPQGDVLIVVFLRGAADGLNIIIPHGDETYYQARPTLGIPRPDDRRAPVEDRVIDLDGFFGMHPALGSLIDTWVEGHLGVLHAVGSPEDSHSHFRAMEYMERGVVDAIGPASGWINRHLASFETGNPSPLRAVGWGEAVQRSLQGSIPVTALQSITEAHLGGDQRAVAHFNAMLSALYRDDPTLGELGQETLEVLHALEGLDPGRYQSSGDQRYPQSGFGEGMKQLSMLIKSEVGLEVAAIDVGGWDTHFAQGASKGLMANLLVDLGEGLAAFHADLHDQLERVSVVVMTEFGRRVSENASLGTDHGHGGVMLLMGGGVKGGKVHAQWPGLEQEQLFGPGDLQITTDYRDVLAEVLHLRLGNAAVDAIFPDYQPQRTGFVRPR